MPLMTSACSSFSWTCGNLKMIEINLATCFLASIVHSVEDSRQLKAISIKSLFIKRCLLSSFVKMTMKDLIKESLKWVSTSSVSFGSISFTFMVSKSSESSSSFSTFSYLCFLTNIRFTFCWLKRLALRLDSLWCLSLYFAGARPPLANIELETHEFLFFLCWRFYMKVGDSDKSLLSSSTLFADDLSDFIQFSFYGF